MTLPALLTFFGLAVSSVDVFGGMVAAAALGRGARRTSLVALLVTYTALLLAGILVLQPVLHAAGRWLAPVLARPAVWSLAQLLVAVVLLGIAVHQLLAVRRPPRERPPRRGMSLRALVTAGALLALTSLVDPPVIASVALAGQVGPPWARVALLIAWQAVYQAPMLVLALAGLTPFRDRTAAAYTSALARWRRPLGLAVALLAGVLGAAGLADAAAALAAGRFPVLRVLLGG